MDTEEADDSGAIIGGWGEGRKCQSKTKLFDL